MQTISLKAAPEVQQVIRAAFPGYKKHNAFLSAFYESGVQVNSFWDGGSKSVFVLIDLATLQHKSLPTSTHPYFDMRAASGETPDVTVDRGCVTLKRLPEGIALVEGGTFCGKLATAHIYLNPANLAKLLPSDKGKPC
jgi:hypothetical protein